MLPNAGAEEACDDDELGEANANPPRADESEPNAGAALDKAGAPKLAGMGTEGKVEGAGEEKVAEEIGAPNPNDADPNPLNTGAEAADADDTCGSNEGERLAKEDEEAFSEGLAELEVEEDVEDDETAARLAFFLSFEGALLESFESELVRENENPPKFPPFMYALQADAID
jgi:hypothetical protein